MWEKSERLTHVVEDAGSKLVCQHLIAAPSGPSLCAPIMAHGEP